METFLAFPVGAFRGTDAAIPFKWPIAHDYVLSGGQIHAASGLKEFSLPLDDPELFSSLARLYERREPSDRKVLGWVKKHGLFTTSDTEQGWLGDPLRLENFRKEARDAHTAWTSLKALSVGNPGIFEHMIRRQRTQGIDKFDRPKGPKGHFARAHVYTGEGDPEATHMVWHGEEVTGDRALSVMLTDLEERVLDKLDLTLRFMSNGEHPRLLANRYRPVPVLMPANLLGAAWLQFCIHVADFDKEWRLCVACGRPFEVPRRDLTTCPGDKACQKKRRRLEKAG